MSTPTESEHLLFGKILVERKLITEGQLEQYLRLQVAEVEIGRPRRSLGDIMVEVGCLTREQLDQTLAEQRKRLKYLVVGPYHIVDKLGSGGMGAVYRAHVPDSGVEVALKLLPKQLSIDPNFLMRFRREANVGMELNHPHIVRTIDFGESKGTYYIAMEVVEGGTLEHHLTVSGAIPERTALKITRDLLGALQYAHEKNVVHRDIKPSNILFDREGKSKLTDFGLAKAEAPDPQFMNQGTTVGTPHYMAPEQARGEDLDIRADLYALGATLYHAVTGRTPFSGSSAAVMNSHLRKELPPPESINPNLSPGCIAIIKTLMAKDRNHRYATPTIARDDVERVLRGEAPIANPPNLSPVPRPPRSTPPSVHKSPETHKPHEVEPRASERSPSRRSHRSRRLSWSVILLFAGIVWLIGILLMIWLIRDVRSQQQTPPPSNQAPTL